MFIFISTYLLEENTKGHGVTACPVTNMMQQSYTFLDEVAPAS